MGVQRITAKQALAAFTRARRFDQFSASAKQRANWRTPSGETASREWARSIANAEKADEQWEIVAAFLEQEAGK